VIPYADKLLPPIIDEFGLVNNPLPKFSKSSLVKPSPENYENLSQILNMESTIEKVSIPTISIDEA